MVRPNTYRPENVAARTKQQPTLTHRVRERRKEKDTHTSANKHKSGILLCRYFNFSSLIFFIPRQRFRLVQGDGRLVCIRSATHLVSRLITSLGFSRGIHISYNTKYLDFVADNTNQKFCVCYNGFEVSRCRGREV